MYVSVGVSLLAVITAGAVGSVPTGPINPAESNAVHEWPAVKEGVWSIEGTLVSKGKKTRRWKATTRRCNDATSLFQGYWGRGKADKDSCLFQSTKLSSSKFEIIGECLVEQYDVVKSESVVTTKDHDSFEMEVKFQDGKVGARARETAHWVSACTEADRVAADKSAAQKAAQKASNDAASDAKTPPNANATH